MDAIQEIKRRLNIVDLVRKMGIEPNEYNKILSIYKTENTPSLMLYPGTNSFFCFSTNKGGDLIDLWMDFYNLDKGQAIKDLASLAGISNESSNFNKREKPSEINSNAVSKQFSNCFDQKFLSCLSHDEAFEFWKGMKSYFSYSQFDKVEVNQLLQKQIDEAFHKVKKSVQKIRLNKNIEIFEELCHYCKNTGPDIPMYNYLVNERGLKVRVIERLRIFYIYDYNKVNNHMKKTFDIKDLQRSGLFNISKEDPEKGNLVFYDHRIILPYLKNDIIIYLRARFFDPEGNRTPKGDKYKGLVNDAVNVNTTKRFYNTDVLESMRKGERIFITEGEIDAISLETLGRNAIAIPGVTSIPSLNQFKQLDPFNVVIVPDKDEAGNSMVERLKVKFKETAHKNVSIKYINAKDVNEFLTN